MPNIITLFTKEEVTSAIETSQNIAEVLEKLKIEVRRGGYRKVHTLAAHYGLTLPKGPRRIFVEGGYKPRNKYSDEEFFIKDVRRDGKTLTKRLIGIGVPYICAAENCGLSKEWLGSHLTLQVDHINGDNYDNRKENLQFLCPNCHTQTSTYGNSNAMRYSYCDCGRRKSINSERCMTCYSQENKLKIVWPDLETIINGVKKMGYVSYASTLGVTDNAVRKYLIRNGVNPLPKFR